MDLELYSIRWKNGWENAATRNRGQTQIDNIICGNIRRIIRKIQTETRKNSEPGTFKLIPNQQVIVA